ncbi:Ig-like domain-containing protein [Gimesia sp.]|uniref:Ig-like domain-containing protein n=1 Tax=Gimesia sp. TaxID=2024833 RepID=UPI003A8F6B20
MLNASPVAAAVIDPNLTSDAGMIDSGSPLYPTAEMTAESTTQVVDVPQDNSPPSSDSESDLLQQFGLTEATDEMQQNLDLVFIDEATDNYQQLIEDLIAQGNEQHRIEIILLDSEQDGILQISEALENYSEIDAVHFVSHGTDQSVKLGPTWLRLDNLERYVNEINGWSNSFTAETDLLFYGCNLAGSDSGQELLKQIQILTGADLAASTDDTGAAMLGGDWDLEYELGELETGALFSSKLQDEWLGLLATETVLDQFSSQLYSNNDGTQNWSSNWVENDNSGSSQSTTSGDVRITGGELRMVGESGASNSVTREVNLSTAHDATLSFDAFSSGTEANDSFSVQISDDGGSSWTVLDVLTDFSGTYSQDISAWMAADTQIRIQIDTGYDGGLLGILFVEYLYIDDVQVSYTVNNLPVITSDGGGSAAAVNVAEDTTEVTTVTATDPNLDTLNYAITGGTDAGKFSIDNATGALSFSVAPDFENPTDSNLDNVYEVIVGASDGFGGADSQTIQVTVTPVNEAPAAANNTVTTSEDTPYTFTAADFNFSDIDGDTLASVKITALETVGALQLSGVDVTLNQVISKADLDAGNLKFAPVSNAHSTAYDSFGFSVNDGTVDSSSTYTMTVDVTSVNDAPTAANNTVTTSEDTLYTFTAADFNFSDIDGDTLASIRITTLETVGDLQLSGVDITLNQVISKADIDAGNLTFTPVPNANGTSYDSFGFSVNDGTADSVSAYTMTVDVTSLNDAPTAANNTVTTNEDTPYTFTAADFNFSDTDGDTLASVKITALETVGALQLSGGDVTLNQVISKADIDAGDLTFTPVPNANGTSYDSFGFSVNDGTADSVSAYTMTVDVTSLNDAPTAANNTVTTNEDTPYTFTAADFNFSDTDGDSLASIRITTLETIGALQLSGLDVSLNQIISKADIDAGNLTFTPVANANGVSYDSFSFTVNDGITDSVSTYTMTIDVTSVNDAPTAVNNTVTTSEDTPYTFNAADFNFSDIDGDTLANIRITTLETVGDLQLSGLDVSLNQVISKADIDAGYLTFAPVANANGTSYDSFEFTVNDGATDSVSAYTMTVDVTSVNDAPTAANNTVTTSEDTPYTFTAADFNFSDIDGDTLANIRITTLETVGDLQLSGIDVTLNQVISKADIDAGKLTFTPVANANGTSYDSFGFTVNDGTVDSVSTYTMTIDVTSVNDAPTAADNTVSTVENSIYTFTAADFSFSDIDGDSLASVKITSLEMVGALQLSGADVTLNQVISKADLDAGNLTFTPVADTNGVAYDSFGFVVNDGTLDSISAYAMTIDVSPDPGNMILDQFGSVSYGNNDGTINWSNDWVEFDNAGSPQSPGSGDVRITGGELRMVGDNGSNNSVTREADLSTAHDATLSFSALSSDTESGDTFSVQISDDGGSSWTVLNVLTDFTGNYSQDISSWMAVNTQLRIQIDSGYDGGLLGLLFVEYLYIDDVQISYTENIPPVITTDGGGATASLNVAENTTAVTTVGASDAELDTLQYTITGGTDAGLFSIDNGTGDLSFISPPDYESPLDSNLDNVYEVTVTASDSFGGSDSQTIQVTVTPVNEAPAAADNTVTTSEDTPYTFMAADFNFSDVDGDSLASIQITTLESVGSLQLSGVDVTLNQIISKADLDAGYLTFTPVVNGSGTSYDSFSFTVNDGTTDSASAYTMTVDVTGSNDAPTASDNTVTMNEDTPYTFTAADFNFIDVDGDTLASIQITTLESVGSLQLSGADVALNQVISKADLDAGYLTFTPIANANGTSYDSFGFTVNDGTLYSSSAYTMTVDVTSVNDAPTTVDNTVTTDEDTPYTFTAADFNFSDVDGDTLLSIRITTLETAGSLQLSGVDVTLNQVISRADIDAGNLTFVPFADENGVSYDSFAYVVNDGALDSLVPGTMTIDVTPIDDAPTAVNSSVTTDEDTPYTFTATDFNFSDADGDSLESVRISSLPTVGALQLSGTDVTLNQVISRADIEAGNLTFVPLADEYGTSYDSFGFIVSDGSLDATVPSTMTVNVTPVNDAPVITSSGGGLNAILHTTGNVLSVVVVEAADLELDTQLLSFSISGGLDAGQFYIDVSTGELSFLIAPGSASPLDGNLNDIYEVMVQVSDGLGGIATQLITIVVDQVNEIFPSDQQPPDETDNPDPSDDPTETEGTDHNPVSGNEDIIYSQLPTADPELFPQSLNRISLRDEGGLNSNTSYQQFNPLNLQTLNQSLANATDNTLTCYEYEGGGGQTTRTALLQLLPAEPKSPLELEPVKFVHTELKWARYKEIEEQVTLTADQQQRLINTAAVITTTVSSGLLLWALQGSYLLAGLASSLPTWRFMDPVAILDQFGEDTNDEGDSLQSIIEQAEAKTLDPSVTSDESEIL